MADGSDELLADLMARGLVLPPDEPGDLLDVEPVTPVRGGRSASAELARMRDEARL